MSERSLQDGSNGFPKRRVGYLQILGQIRREMKHGHDGLHLIVLVELVSGGEGKGFVRLSSVVNF